MQSLLEASWFTPREIIALDFHANGLLDVEKAKWWQISGDRYIMTDLELEKGNARAVGCSPGGAAPSHGQ